MSVNVLSSLPELAKQFPHARLDYRPINDASHLSVKLRRRKRD